MPAGKNIKIGRAPVRSAIALTILAGAGIAYKYFAPVTRHKVVARPDLASKFTKDYFIGFEDDYWTPIYETRTEPINPDKIAVDLAAAMDGVNMYTTMDEYYDLLLDELTYNDLRLIHNAWLKKIDNRLSVYDWISREWEYNDVESVQLQLMKKFDLAGVGHLNALKIPHRDLLLI